MQDDEVSVAANVSLRVDRIASNLAEDLELGRDTSVLEPAPRMSPNIPTMSLHTLANAMEAAATAAPPPVYALQHPLGLAHNVMPFVGGQYVDPPNDPPIQIASMVATAITTAMPTSALQQWAQSGGRGGSGGGGSGSRGGGGGGGSRGGPPGGQPPATPASAKSEIILKHLKTPYCYLMGKLSKFKQKSVKQNLLKLSRVIC